LLLESQNINGNTMLTTAVEKLT